jgi:toluene monooxygenase system ferredoxin subunit
MNANPTILETLKGAALFSELSAETLEAIAEIAVQRNFEEGDSIYSLGDDAVEIFVVANGRIRFSLGAGNRAGASGSIMNEGQLFGWAALLEDQSRRVATASCLENSSVLAINGKKLQEIFASDTASGYRFIHGLAGMIANNFMDVLSN